MLKQTEEVLEQFGKELVPELQQSIIDNHDTGNYLPRAEREKMAATIRFEISPNGFKLYGGQWIWTYEYGRGITVNDGDGAVRRNVLAYLKEQGITSKYKTKDGKDIDQNLLAFFISRRIHQEGSIPYRTNTVTGVISSVINEGQIKKLKDRLLFEFKTVVRSTLFETA